MAETDAPENPFSWKGYLKTWAVGLIPLVPTIRQYRRAKLERGANIEAELFLVMALCEVTMPLLSLLTGSVGEGVAMYALWRAAASAIQSVKP